MEKLKKTFSREFKSAYILYLDDIGEILEIMINLCSEVTIKTDEYLIENIAELENLKKDDISFLSMECKFHSPVKFEIAKNKVTLVSDNDVPDIRGAYLQIKEILDRRIRKFPSTVLYVFPLIVLLGLFFIINSNIFFRYASIWENNFFCTNIRNYQFIYFCD